jgi:uncharacterized damage-inducible protein DinB
MSTPAEAHLLETIRFEFARMKQLAEKALNQISDEGFVAIPFEEGNSCAIVVQHMAGNLLSRWTDFLTSDGEKDWRNRDAEFEAQNLPREELMQQWETGWQALFNALDTVTPAHLMNHIYIRKEPLTVLQALQRQVAHYSYHSGQIVLLARFQAGKNWQSLSIPRGKSTGFAGNYLNK